MSDKELKVMESKVREAMGSCQQVKEVLEKLFGEQMKPPMPRLQAGDIVRGRGKHLGYDIDGSYGVAFGRTSPYMVRFFNLEKNWIFHHVVLLVPAESLDFVYRPEK